MTREQELAARIARVFSRVTLGAGIDIHAAQSLDDHGNPEEDRLSGMAEREDWRRVRAEILYPRYTAVTFLDAAGFRFYTPAILTALLSEPQPGEMLSEAWLSNSKVSHRDGMIKGVPLTDLFNKSQRAAVVRFLKYATYRRTTWFGGSDVEKRLAEFRRWGVKGT